MLRKISKARHLMWFIQTGCSEGSDGLEMGRYTVGAQFHFQMCEDYMRDKTIFDTDKIKFDLLRRIVILADKLEFPISE